MPDQHENQSQPSRPSHYGEAADRPDDVVPVSDAGKDEVTENIVPVNLFLVIIFGALVFWGGVKIIQDTQDFDPLIYNPYQEKVVGPVEPPSLAEIGQKVYKKNCAVCHQADGNGNPTFPTLHGTKWVNGSKERVINILLSGLNGPIDVNGVEYVGNMPSWGAALDDLEIAGVLTYVRTNADWGNESSEITEEEVAKVRAEYGSRTQAWTGPELLELFPDSDESTEATQEQSEAVADASSSSPNDAQASGEAESE